MKILFISPSSPPVPYGTGLQVHNWGNIKILQLLGHEIYLVMLKNKNMDSKSIIEKVNESNDNLKLCRVLNGSDFNYKSLNSLSLEAVFSEILGFFFKGYFYNFPVSQKLVSSLDKIIKNSKIDMIWYEDYYVAVYDEFLKRTVPAVYNSHDVQAELIKKKYLDQLKNFSSIGSILRKLIHFSRYNALKASEVKIKKKCDIMFSGNYLNIKDAKLKHINAIYKRVPIQGPDRNYLSKRKDWINNIKIPKKKVKLIHVGALHGSFTSRSLLWFFETIWDDFLKGIDNKSLELHIIGGGTPSDKLNKFFNHPQVIYRGYVKDLWKEFINTFAMLIPGVLHTGIRVRLPVAFSMMIPIIGNEISFYGMK